MNVKKKGNLWENKLANWLRDHGIKAWKDGASGGKDREKGDVGNNIDFTIESKAAKNISLMDWWKQVSKSASMHHNSPLLFIHQDGMRSEPPEWLVVLHSEDFIELLGDALKMRNSGVLEQIEPTLSKDQARTVEYNLERARYHTKQALKEME